MFILVEIWDKNNQKDIWHSHNTVVVIPSTLGVIYLLKLNNANTRVMCEICSS